MSKREKLRQKLKNNPNSVNFNDLRTLLTNFGFMLIRTSGSHHLFQYDDGTQIKSVTIPVHGNKVKAFYVKKVTDLLDVLFPEDTITDSEGEDENE